MAKSILLLGATGPAGIAVIRRAISDSITVLVYARTPSKLPADLLSHNLVKVLPGGTLDDVDSLHAAVAQKPDAIVSLLGPPPSETKTWMNPFAKDRASLPFADAYNVVVEAMKEHGVRRILVMGTLSIPDAKDHTSLGKAAMVWVVWLVMNRAYRNIVAVGNFFDTVSKEDVDWTIFRLGLVADGRCALAFGCGRGLTVRRSV